MHGNPYCRPILLLLQPHMSIRGKKYIDKDHFKLPVIGCYDLVMEMATVELYDRFSITVHSKSTCCIYHWVCIVLASCGSSNSSLEVFGAPLMSLHWKGSPLPPEIAECAPEPGPWTLAVWAFSWEISSLFRIKFVTWCPDDEPSASTWPRAGARSPTEDSRATAMRLPHSNIDSNVAVPTLVQWEGVFRSLKQIMWTNPKLTNLLLLFR